MKRISVLKAVRAKCLDCSGGLLNEVKFCPCEDCTLHPFRMGKNPFRKPMSEERRRAAGERLKNRFQSRQAQ